MSDFINSTVNTKIYNLMSDEHQIITIIDKEAIVENIGTIVSGDTNSCLLTFEINRFQDGVDLSDKKIRFNYRNNNGKFYDIAVNVKYNDDVIRFYWLLPYSLTQPGGNVIASIEFYGYIEYDEEYSYKTKNFKLSVEKSLGVNDEFDKSYSNWAIRIENDVETIQKKISEIEKEIKSIHVPTKLSEMDDDAEHRTVSDSQIDKWNEAHKNSQADWNEENTNSSAYIKNKPQIPNVTNDLTDELKSSYDEAVDKKHTHSNMSVLDGITYENIESWNNKSEFDGQYSSLQGIPDDIATETYVDEKVKNKVNESDLATVAKTGLYNDLKDKPSIVGDVQIDGISIVGEDGVAKMPIANNGVFGIVRILNWQSCGLLVYEKSLRIAQPNDDAVINRLTSVALTPSKADIAVKLAMTDGKGEAWTDSEKTGAWSRLSSIKIAMDEVAVAGASYILGELTELSVVLPDDALTGQEVTVAWYNGATPSTISITGNMLDFDYTPESNTRSEISALWDGKYWSVIGMSQEVPVEEVVANE